MSVARRLRAGWRPAIPRVPASVPLTLARILAAALGFASTMLLAPALGPAALGVFALALSVQAWSQHAAELGLRTAVTAAAAEAGSARELVVPYLVARLTTTALTIALVTSATAMVAPATLPIVLVVLLSLVPMALSLDWVPLVTGRPLSASLPLVVRPALFLAGVATATTLGPEPPGAMSAAILFSLAWLGACVITWPPALPFAWRAPARRVAALWRAGPPLAGNSLLNQALVGVDLWAVAHIAGLAAAGAYFLAAQIATAGAVTANALGQLRLARPGPQATSLAGLIGVTWLGTGIAAAMIALAPLVVSHALGRDYALIPLLLAPLGLWCALQHLSAPLQAVITRARRPGRLLAAAWAGFAATLLVLALAALVGSVVIAACARALAEVVRIAVLLGAVPVPDRAAIARDAALPGLLLLAVAAAAAAGWLQPG